MGSTGLFIKALNEMIDIQGKRLAELRNQIPEFVLLTLFAVTAITGAVAGYAGGLEERPNRLPAYVMGVLICAIIFVILDLAGPKVGFIRIDQQAMIDTAASIAAFPD